MRSATEGPEAVRPVYLDHNATTPVDPRVLEAALPYLTREFGNPSSSHAYGAAPYEAIERARDEVGALLGGTRQEDRAGEVVFTGSGSEANLLALRGSVLSPRDPRSHVITQATEHPAVLATCAALARHHGTRITVLPVDTDGLVDPAVLAMARRGATCMQSPDAVRNYLRLALHDPAHLEREAPRFLRLLRDYAHGIECRRTPRALRELTDSFCIADDLHIVRRFHSDHLRGEAAFDAPQQTELSRLRFDAIWAESQPGLQSSVTGL